MRRLVLALLLILAAVTAAPRLASAQQSDASLMQAAVGRWEWQAEAYGMTVSYTLTLAGDGKFAYTGAAGAFQVTSTGVWAVQDGWLAFTTTWSSSLDPTGHPIVVPPAQILEIGPDFMRTSGGTVRRTG